MLTWLSHIYFIIISYVSIFFLNDKILILNIVNPSNTASFSHVSVCGNQCEKRHSDMKPLEGYDKIELAKEKEQGRVYR